MARKTTIILALPLGLPVTLFLLAYGSVPGSQGLYSELRESMLYGQFIVPEFRAQPSGTGRYLGLFSRHPEYSGGLFTPHTVHMPVAVAFENGCAAAESEWVVVNDDYVEISEFVITRFNPHNRCH